jgi:hypothetical protein
MKLQLLSLCIFFGGCHFNQDLIFDKEIILKNNLSKNILEFSVNVSNPTNKNITIEKIVSGCKLMVLEDNSVFILKPNESIKLNFAYEKDKPTDSIINKSIVFRTNTSSVFNAINVKSTN